MRQVLSMILGSVVLVFSLTSVAGDCNKTVMGGGCSGQAQAGVSPHMQSQNPLNTVTKVKTNAVVPAVKTATPAKVEKVSNVTSQKPQI